jgi:hypothetical protein
LAVITSRLPVRNKLSRAQVTAIVAAALKAAVLFLLVQRLGLWPLAVALVVVAELWPVRAGVAPVGQERSDVILDRLPALLVGLSVVLLTAVSLRLATQIWWRWQRDSNRVAFINLLVVQVVMFEAIFLMAAVWRSTPMWLVLFLVWLGAYLSVYAVLARRGERTAGVMAATWGVVCVEIAWVLLSWLFVYTIGGGYILVPQPALILTAIAYCFGSIYVSQREGTLSRGRLGEYLVIGLVLIGIVVVGTSWRGSI